MHYINDPKTTLVTYDQAVDTVIKAGIDPKRAYLYLAAINIRGELARIKKADDVGYNKPTKMAYKNDDFVHEIAVCNKCGNVTAK